jgi:signal transduction histidine kinase
LVQESLDLILDQTRRISNIVRSLVSFSHSGTPTDLTPAPLAVGQCVDEAMRLVKLSHAGKQIEFVNACPPEHRLYGDRQRLSQVFVNLLTNACDASRPGDRITVASRLKNDFVEVEVSDEGEGIPEELLGRVFEPFFTTKQPGEGTGLGLPMVYNIVQEHSGSVSIVSREGFGTRVILKLPATLDDIGREQPLENRSK